MRKTWWDEHVRETQRYGVKHRNQRRRRKRGRGVEFEQIEIPRVSDVICSSSTRQESVICSTKTADFIRQNRAGQGRAALWLVFAQYRHSLEAET